MTHKTYCDSPIGPVEIIGTKDGITSVSFVEEKGSRDEVPVLAECRKQLEEYFAGKRREFTVPLVFERGTEFQKKVWKELAKIPFGKTVSYKDVAESLGNPKAVRAVGGASSKNPIGIIVPCHRVIGSDGKLTGYYGGVWRKEWLLDHEKTD